MEDCLISICVEIAKYTVAPIGRQLGYLCFYKRNVDELKARIEDLRNALEELQRRVADAKRNGEDIEANVEKLLTTVRQIIADNDKFIRDEEQANTKCCTVLRYRLSKKANEKAQAIHIGVVKNLEKISYCPHLPISVENKGYHEFDTRKQTLSDIMRALRDPNVCVIGVCGMGGVGKTMLAKEVARIAKDEEKLFNEVVFTTISQTPNIEKILEDIRKRLGIEKQDNVGGRIKNRLRKENNVLLILDDVWKKSMPVISQLADIGISSVEDKKGFKILVTSRDHGVLNNYNDMNVDKACIFEVGFLSEDESLRLFRNIVGDQPLATEIVNECGGLPIAITTVASALKRRSHQVWNNALDELRKSDPVNIDGMHEKVYSSIKLSYDFLQSKEAKKLLLLCSLFQEDAEIPVELLCHYGIGLNLFEGTTKLQVATNKTVTLVETLKDHSLLLMGNDYEDRGAFVKLHDVIRDVVINIASKDDDFRMRNFEDAVAFEEFLDTEEFKKTTAISLYDIKADVSYPETLKSPKLKLLRLIHGYRNEAKKEFQHHFFEGLDGLLVLHLEQVSLDFKRLSLEASQASSFCLLQNLRTLRLIECDLGYISWIGELKNLKILYLSDWSITELPEEIGNLNRLLSLHLPWCPNLQVIRPNVISRLTRLEELNLPSSFTNWEDGEGAVNANLGEVKNLRDHLTNLSLTVPDVNILPNNMFSEKLNKFYIKIGTVDSFFLEKNFSRMLTLKLHPDSVLEEHDFEVLLKRSELLGLSGLKSAKSIAYELDCEGFPNLEELRIEDSTEILCILSSNEKKDNRAAFGKLRDIEVERCNKMKSLFSIYFPEQLERIRVWNCEMVEEIISDGREGDGDLLKISKLHDLSLSNLPKLVQFKATTKKSDEIREGAQSIDDLVVPLFNGEVVFPELKYLGLTKLNVGKIWNGDQLRSSESGFQNLTSVRVNKCDELKGLIPLSVARSLVHLEWLEVENCEAMEEIVFVEESTQEAKTFENISFPKLETLRLRNLPNLKRFYAGDCVDCSSLLELWIVDCPKLREFSINTMPTTENENYEDLLDQADKQLLFNHKDLADQFKIKRLERLCLQGLPTLEQLPKTFQNVETLEIIVCDNLKVLAPPSMSLQTLTILEVSSCSGLPVLYSIDQPQKVCHNSEN